MPKLYRFLLAAIPLVVLMGGTVAFVVTPGDPTPPLLALQTVALVLATTPALVVGLIMSMWSWRGELARRHRRRLVVIAAILSVAGAAVLIGSATIAGAPAFALVAVVALACLPASVALGRAARRAEERAGAFGARRAAAPSDEIVPLMRRARRHALTGVAVGSVVGAAIAIGLSTVPDDDGSVQPLTGVSLGLSIALLIAMVPRFVDGIRMSRSLRAPLGGDYAGARRIGRAIAGKERLDDDEIAPAARYARVALRTTPFLQNTSLLVVLAVAVQQIGPTAEEGLDPLRTGVLLMFALLIAVALPLRFRELRRLRAFLAAHPAR